MLFCFFKQKTAYEMRISAWSSDVCSSDLAERTQQLEILEARDRRGDGRCGSGRNGIGAVSRCRVRAAVDKAVNSGILQPNMRPRPTAGERSCPDGHPISRCLRKSRSARSEEHTSELQSLMRKSYSVLCLK